MERPIIFITGGAGYVGSVLVPKLLEAGYPVRVLDLFLYGKDTLAPHPNLELIEGDIRDTKLLMEKIAGCHTVIHLACISNDPSFELNPELGRSINFDAFEPLVDISIASGVRRFIYASSSSVYGLKASPNVTEDLELEPLTDYSKFKAECEQILNAKRSPGFATLIIRPATVCGYSPRQRLDVIVNILTTQAVNNRRITIFGGSQLRPNIHIQDMADLYVEALSWPIERIDGQTYNAGYENHSVREIADMVAEGVGGDVAMEVTPSNDNRSYHISSDKLLREQGFSPKHDISEAVAELAEAFSAGKLPNALDDARYYNIKTMQAVNLV